MLKETSETSDRSVTALLVDNPAAIRDGVTFYRSKLNAH